MSRSPQVLRDGRGVRHGRRLQMAKVVRVDVDGPFEPILVDPRYADVLLVVLRRGRVVGHVTLPALSLVSVELQQSSIANVLGDVLWRDELRESLMAGAQVRANPEPGESTTISVVICTRDRPEQLRSCIESVLKLRAPPSEILVVDNAPSDDQTRRICEEYPVRYLCEPKAGVSRARNRAIAETVGDLIAFTDDDCVVDEGWLDNVPQSFADPLVMAVTGYVGPFELETPAQYLFEAQGGFDRGFERVVYDGLTASPVLAASPAGASANAIFRRTLFSHIGPFPEDLGPGTPARAAEDTYVSYRTLAAGYRIVFDPSRIVWHRHRSTMRALRAQLFDYGVATMAFATRCFLRHREPAALALVAWWVMRRVPTQLARILRRDERRLPLRLILAESAGMLLGPWRLLRSRLTRPPALGVELAPRAQASTAALSVRDAAARVSVVVPSYNRRDGLRALLHGLERQTCSPDLFEAVVVLDGSTDGSAELLHSLHLPFTLHVITQPNSGAATARNRGAQEASHPLLVFLDDDIVPQEEFVARHVLAHRTARDVVVGYCPPVISANDLWSLTLRAWWEDHFRRKAEPGHRWSYTDFSIGNSSLPRSLYLDAGGLDVGFGNARREDWEFGVRLAERGAHFRYEPGAVGLHHLDTRLSTRLRQLRQEAHGDVLFATKHPEVKSSLLVAELAALIGSDNSSADWAYRHVRAADALRRAAVPLLGLYEHLHLRKRWSRLLQRLMGLAYLVGVADRLPTQERLLAFFADSWSEEPSRVSLSLDRPRAIALPFGVGPVELALDVQGHEVARFLAFRHSAQWSWEELAERVLGEAVWDARTVALLDGLAFRRGAQPVSRASETAHAR